MRNRFANIDNKNSALEPKFENLNDMVYLNFISGRGNLSSDNDVHILNNGHKKFESLISDIKLAKKFIHMEYYILQNDYLGRRILDELSKKASEGVKVRLYVDGMGSYLTSKRFYKNLISKGGEVCIFYPTNFIRINFRNHRKIAVIDGYKAYIGGMNIGDEYLGLSKKFGLWRDMHIKIMGTAAAELNLRFIMDWNFSSSKKIDISEFYFPTQPRVKYGQGKIQIISSGPDTKYPNIQYSYTKMITEANKYVYIQTPYFVPHESILESIKIAALSGIDVKIMIPSKPDHPFVYWASLSYIGSLIEFGVKCYSYTEGVLHSKLLIIDGLVSYIGTANVDMRSLRLNFESNAFIFDEKIAKTLETDYINDIKNCTQIDVKYYNKRSINIKIKEAISRLLSPLL